jgi:multidrug efflux pump subunit AcrA (membrane-fusion protein)
MRSGLKLVLITLPLAAIGAGILGWVVATSPPPAQEPPGERTTAVRVIVATERMVTPRVTGFGLVSPARTFEAIAEVGGVVEHVNPELKRGAILPAGAVLWRLSPVDFNLAIAQAKANIRAAEAKLAELAVSEENQTAALAIETEALALKQSDFDRSERLHAGGTVSQAALDAARGALLAQRQKVQSVESSLALVPTQREVQTEQIAVYRANLETATLNLGRTEMTLPFPARVAQVSVEVAQFVRVGQTTALLDGIDIAEVEAQVPVAALRGLVQTRNPDTALYASDPTLMTDVLRGLDLTAEVRLVLGEEEVRWPARVDRISETIDPKTGMLGVIVQVDAAYAGATPGERLPLTKGMFVKVTLSSEPAAGIVVPVSALRNGAVYVAGADNRLTPVPVVPAMIQDGIAVIRDGLSPGQRVVVSDPGPLLPGMLLEVTEDEALMTELAR